MMMKKELREHIQKTREKLAQAPEAKNKEAWEKLKEKLEQELKDLEAQERLANFEIQRLMSQYNQAEHTASRTAEKWNQPRP
jgi:predicted  nucleic acid-binding Zn-ribbon protein